MRIVAWSALVAFWGKHPETKPSLTYWHNVAKASSWQKPLDVISSFPKAKTLNEERVRFEVAGGDYRLIVAFDFRRQIAFVKFIGTHAEYDRVNALAVSNF